MLNIASASPRCIAFRTENPWTYVGPVHQSTIFYLFLSISIYFLVLESYSVISKCLWVIKVPRCKGEPTSPSAWSSVQQHPSDTWQFPTCSTRMWSDLQNMRHSAVSWCNHFVLLCHGMLSKYKFDCIRLELEWPPSAPLQAPQIHRHLAPKSGMRIAPAQCELMRTAMLIEAGISFQYVRVYSRIAHAQPSAYFSLTFNLQGIKETRRMDGHRISIRRA